MSPYIKDFLTMLGLVFACVIVSAVLAWRFP